MGLVSTKTPILFARKKKKIKLGIYFRSTQKFLFFSDEKHKKAMTNEKKKQAFTGLEPATASRS